MANFTDVFVKYIVSKCFQDRGCPGVPVHEGIPFVFITIHGVMTHSLMFPSFVYRYTRTQPKSFEFPESWRDSLVKGSNTTIL